MNYKIPKNPWLFGIFISKSHKKWVVIALLSVVTATAIDRFSVVILRILTDSLTESTIDFRALWFWALAYPIFNFLGRLAWRSSGFSGMRWFTGFDASAYRSLYEYLTLHSKDYFNSRFAGALVNKITNAVDGADFILDRVLWKFIPLIFGLVLYIGIAWSADFRLGLVLLVWAIFFLGINLYFSKKLQPYSHEAASASSILKGKIVDSLGNISLVHEYAYVGGERNYISGFISKYQKVSMKSWNFSEKIMLVNGIFMLIFDIAMVIVALYLLQTGQISLGIIIMVIAIISDLSGQFVFIAQEMKETAAKFGQAKEGLDEILSDHTIKDAENAKDFNFPKGEIKISSLEFNYENKSVFKDFSITIPAGEKVGFVGRSGAGKSTFVALLLRHFEIQNGDIKIDDESIYGVTLESLRRSIAFVPQDTSLFHRTIGENIGYSNPKATREDVIKVARLAHAHEFIRTLPKGYDTLVGERGVKLSGGQRQRISIARAFLKDSPILILDEATSSLDSESEQAIQESLEKLMQGRTVIAIAHRLSTLKKMDRIVMIEDGKIIEDGKPEKLLENKNGLFKKMWEHQVKGFIIEE